MRSDLLVTVGLSPLALAFSMAGCVSPAFGQQAQADAGVQAEQNAAASSDTSLDASESGDIVVTAQRRNESIQRVPVSVQAFSGSQLAERGIGQVQDLQKVATNVTISSPLGEGTAPAINIRGIGLNDFNTNNAGPNGFNVDEFAISSPNAQGVSFFDIERVEVLKGPQGTLFGRNASGGAINITTAAPTERLSGFGRVSYGSFNTVNAEGAISGALSDTLSARISGMYRYSEGFMYNRLFDRHENGVNMWGVRGQLRYELSSDFSATLKLQAVGNRARAARYKNYGLLNPQNPNPSDRSTWCSVADVYASRGCVDFFGYASPPGSYEGDYNYGDKADMQDRLANLRMRYEFGDGFSLVSVTGYNHNKRFHPEEPDSNPFRVLEIAFNTTSQEFTQEVRIAQEATSYNWVIGGYFIDERIRQNQPVSAFLDADTLFGAPGAFDGIAFIQQTRNRQRLRSEAVFGQGEYKFNDVFSVLAGARYTWEQRRLNAFGGVQFQSGGQDKFGPLQDVTDVNLGFNSTNFSWKVGGKAQVSPQTMFFGTVSTGYKGGGYNGGFLSLDPVQRLLQLRPFKPEIVTAYEIGFKTQFFDRAVTLNGSIFLNDYKNQQVSTLVQVPDPTQPTGLQIFFALDNARKARIKGLDAELAWRVTRDLSLGANVGYLDAKFTDFNTAGGDYTGNRLSLAPKWTTTLTAQYEKKLGAVTLKADYDASYRSKVFFEPTNDPYVFQNKYWLHNARIGLTLDESQVTIAAFARNFTKTKYSIWTSGLFDPFGLLQATQGQPRSFGVEAGVKF